MCRTVRELEDDQEMDIKVGVYKLPWNFTDATDPDLDYLSRVAHLAYVLYRIRTYGCSSTLRST